MTQDNPFADAWRTMLQQWEGETNKMLNQATGTEESAKALNTALSGALQLQSAFQETMEKSLNALNMPSRSDVLHLSEQIDALSRKMDELIEDKGREGASVQHGTANAPKPARTRKPPKDKAPST